MTINLLDISGKNQPGHSKGQPLMIWTRSIDDLVTDRQILMALPVDIIHVPCISIELLPIHEDSLEQIWPENMPENAEIDIIFTSQNAVAACAQSLPKNPSLARLFQKTSRIVTHGRKTAAAAEKAFNRDIDCIDSMTSAALVDAIVGTADNSRDSTDSRKQVWFSGEDIALDLENELNLRGSSCSRIIVYRTTPMATDQSGKTLAGDLLKELQASIAQRCRATRVTLCFASPSAVSGWMALARGESELDPGASGSNFSVAAIGPTTARAARDAGFKAISTCPWPGVADLAALGSQLTAD